MRNVQDNAAHTCSYSCDRPECIKAQRDELAAAAAQEAVGWFTDDYLTDKSATTYDPLVAERWRNKGWPVTALYAAPVTAAPEASYFEYLDRYNHSLRRAIHAMMAKLVFLLDEDQFADIEAIALAAGVTPAAPGIDPHVLARDIHHAIADTGLAPLSPADNHTLREVIRSVIDASPKGATFPNDGNSEAQFIADGERLNCPACGGSGHVEDSPEGGSEARDAARLDWLDANGFTAYRQIDPIDGLSSHCVVVHETQLPRRGNVHDTIRGAIDAAMRGQAGSAEVRP